MIKYLGFDCAYFCWRAFHTTGDLSFDGQATGVIHGFLSQVLIMSRQFGITEPLFFWDSRKRFRHKILPTYKTRPTNDLTDKEKEARAGVYIQMNALRNSILPVIGFNNIFKQTGLEADDLIARFVRDNPGTTVVLTNDDDLLQLTDDCVWHSPQRKTTYNEKAFREKYGIAPRDWRRVKQIAGCSSDTVPGVRGVGDITALKYLRGELTKGAAWAKITSPKGRWLAKRNRALVNLPFEGTKRVEVVKDNFNVDGFLAVCDMYGLDKLADNAGEWKNHFGRM